MKLFFWNLFTLGLYQVFHKETPVIADYELFGRISHSDLVKSKPMNTNKNFESVHMYYSTEADANRAMKELKKLSPNSELRISHMHDPILVFSGNMKFLSDCYWCSHCTSVTTGVMWIEDDELGCKRCGTPVERMEDLSTKEVIKRVKKHESAQAEKGTGGKRILGEEFVFANTTSAR